MKKKAKKRKQKAADGPRALSAGWGTYLVLGAALVVILWLALNPFLNQEAPVLGRFGFILVTAAVVSAVLTYSLNSALAAWSKRRRRRS